MTASDSPFTSKAKLREFMLQSLDGILDLLNSLAHPRRMELLLYMLGGRPISFKELQEQIDLQKSALAHHLSVLVDKSLVEKTEKGVYQITLDGDDLLERIAHSFLEAKFREQARLEQLLQMIGKTSPYPDIEVTPMVQEKEVLKIVRLPPLRVISIHAQDSESPELDAWGRLEAWAKPKGLFDRPDKHQIYGFNNPNPTKDNPRYGYEFWITIDDDFQVDADLPVKSFDGGLYAVMTCRGAENIGPTWSKLVKRVEASKYRLVKTHQWLEHHINPHNMDPNTFVLDLYAPIAD
ncbi:MAG: ArsR family transcriptional regulator [Candidatus Heimdallarchaeota archaeon]|nr:ArsR family transcriptional regulator [Candidatus Heimdallarchaeota archaeon]